jgi:hypothetical protein
LVRRNSHAVAESLHYYAIFAMVPFVVAEDVRRYSINTLRSTAFRNRLSMPSWTYWGLPLVPTLMVRKFWLKGKRNQNNIIKVGFDSRAPWINTSLEILSGCEWIPQKRLGTSLMAVLQTGIGGQLNAG